MQLAKLEFVREDIPSAINQKSRPNGTRAFIHRAYPKKQLFFSDTGTKHLLMNSLTILKMSYMYE